MLKILHIPKFPIPLWTGIEQVFVFSGYRYEEYVSITNCIEVPNSSDTPADTFVITAGSLLSVVMTLSPPETIVGFGHTHPADMPSPSDEDIEGIDDESFGVVLCNGNAVWYDNKGVIFPRLLG